MAEQIDPWRAYLQKLQEEGDAIANTPPAPMYSPEEVTARRGANQRQQMLGTLGALTDDSVMQGVGGNYLKNAIENARQKTTEKGVMDPLSGEMKYFPQYQQELKQTRHEKKTDRANELYLKSLDAKQKAADQAQLRRDLKGMGAGIANAIGTGQQTPIGIGEGAKPVFRTKGGQLYVYDDKGQAIPYASKVYDRSAIPSQTLREIAEKKAYLGEHKNFADTFKNEFAGTAPGLGKIEAATGRYTGGPAQPMAEWWQVYRNWTINLRRDLFGTALTAPEKALFDEANIEPGMHPDTIRRRMQQQQLAITRAVNKSQGEYSGHYGMQPLPEPNVPAPGTEPASPMSIWNSSGPLGQLLGGRPDARQGIGANTPTQPQPGGVSGQPGSPAVAPISPGLSPEKQRRLEELRRLQAGG